MADFKHTFTANIDIPLEGTVTGHLIPDSNVTYDLGEPENKFRDLYLDSATIHTTDGNISTVGGQLTFDGEPVILVSSLKELVDSSDSWDDFKTRVTAL